METTAEQPHNNIIFVLSMPISRPSSQKLIVYVEPILAAKLHNLEVRQQHLFAHLFHQCRLSLAFPHNVFCLMQLTVHGHIAQPLSWA